MTDFATGTPGRRVFISQIETEAPPYTNCRLVALMMLLCFGGLAFTDRRKFLLRLRAATGIPEVVGGKAKGTNAVDIVRALAVVLPWVYVEPALMTPVDVLKVLSSGQAVASADVTYGLLPSRLRRWSPKFTGGHEIALLDARYPLAGTDWEVLWADPLGTGSYVGEWVKWSAVRPAMWGDGSRVAVTLMERGAALSTAILPRRIVAASVKVPAGVLVYTFDAGTLAFKLPGTPAPAEILTTTDGVFTVAQMPQRPPSGPFVRLADGRFVRESDAIIYEPDPVTPPETPAEDAAEIAAAVAAATAPLTDRLVKVAAAMEGYQP